MILLVLFFCYPLKAQNNPASIYINGGINNPEIPDKIKDDPLYTFNVHIGGYLQLWYIYEGVENGKRQRLTNDEAAQQASGFSFNRARVYIENIDGKLRGKISAKLESGTPSMLDAYVHYLLIKDNLQLRAGQMKIPSTYEVETSSSNLEFATRSRFTDNVANWSLSKSTSSISPFTSVQTYYRDLGVAIRGNLYGFTYHCMISNGLGANLFVGGNESRQFVYTNTFGAYFFGTRLSWDIMRLFHLVDFPVSSFRLGGHRNRNRHPNILYNDTKTVLDIDRESWSSDIQIIIFNRIRLTGMYGKGVVEDDFDNNNEPDYRYHGYELRVIVEILKDRLEAGFRFDSYTDENSIFGGEETMKTYTLGINYYIPPGLRMQPNYKWKRLEGELNIETNDDIFILSAQYEF